MHLVNFINVKFSTTKLSTGQRKRLALFAALAEKRPILILDEWAADQDPGFRLFFYNEILPYIKNENITIIAITHDETYFNLADRRLHLESGTITQINKI
jgi:putative ATP-binding cassette transporter